MASIAFWGFAALAPESLRAAEPAVQLSAYNLFTAEEEVRLGSTMASEFEQGHQLVSNSLLEKYLDGVVTRLGKASRRPELTFTCKIVNSPDVNAFSFPGGAVYVTTGMLAFAEDESELAAVLAHEIGHIAGRHLLNRLSIEIKSKAMWEQLRTALPLLDAKTIRQSFQKLGIPLVNVVARQYDRGNESDADLLGAYNAIRAGWNPLGAVRALDRMNVPGQSGSAAAAILATHPNPIERSRAVSAEIKNMALSGSLDETSLSFRAMKLGLGLLPKSPDRSR